MPDYSEMSCSFLNLDDEQRAFIATNFYQLDEGLTEYLVFRNLKAPDSSGQQEGKNSQNNKAAQQAIHISRPKDILPEQIEYLGLKVEARHL